VIQADISIDHDSTEMLCVLLNKEVDIIILHSSLKIIYTNKPYEYTETDRLIRWVFQLFA